MDQLNYSRRKQVFYELLIAFSAILVSIILGQFLVLATGKLLGIPDIQHFSNLLKEGKLLERLNSFRILLLLNHLAQFILPYFR